ATSPLWNSHRRPPTDVSCLEVMVQVLSRSALESSQAPTIGVPASPCAWAREAKPALPIDAIKSVAVNCGRVIAVPGFGDQKSVVGCGRSRDQKSEVSSQKWRKYELVRRPPPY